MLGAAGMLLAVAINLALVALMGFCGLFASRGSIPAFLVGILLYCFDTWMVWQSGNTINLVAHGLFLVFLYGGMMSRMQLGIEAPPPGPPVEDNVP